MRNLIFLLSLLCVTAGRAQLILDTLVYFPEPVDNIFHITGGNKLYVFLRSAHLYILDCATMEVRKIFPPLSGKVGAWCPKHNKVYLAPLDESLAVVDNTTDSLLRYLKVEGGTGIGVAYNPIQDRLYCTGGDGIISIDCSADTIFKIIPTDWTVWYFAVWDSVGDKMYFGSCGWENRGEVTVLDCGSDSVVKVIYSGIVHPGTAVYNPLRRKLYVGTSVWWEGWG